MGRMSSYITASSQSLTPTGSRSSDDPSRSSRDTNSTFSTHSRQSILSRRRCRGDSRIKSHSNLEIRAGRAYLDPSASSAAYPLPLDLAETHRNIMFAQLTELIFRTPVLSPDLLENPPLRVLDLCCDTGWWSANFHQRLEGRGHPRVEFVGLDIKAPSVDLDEYYEELGMNWQYVQHDVNDTPFPFEDGSFDLIMVRNITLAIDPPKTPHVVGEYARLLKKGGTLELWEHDVTIRTMLPSIQNRNSQGLDELGLYPWSSPTDFSAPTNPFAVELVGWMLAVQSLAMQPCSHLQTFFEGNFLEGCEFFDITHAKRLAVPLYPGAMDWETTEDGEPRALSEEQTVIRSMMLDSFVNMVDAMAPAIMDISGKRHSDWDEWFSQAKRNWLQEGGLRSGECLELGTWSMTKNC